MNICIYGGTFNPIHNAHLRVAKLVKEALDLDEIIFIPSHIPPHKNADILPSQDRLNMIKLSLKGSDGFKFSDVEIKKEQTSYTYLTIKELYKNIEELEKVYFLIGTDAFKKIDSWYEVDKLAKLVEFVVVPRDEGFDKSMFLKFVKNKNVRYQFINVPFVDISSTQIRELLNDGKTINHLVPKEVEDYIIKKKLFLGN